VLLLQVAVAAVLVGVVAALLTRGTVVLTGRFGGRRVSRVLADTEYIVEHHAVPPAWLAKLHENLLGLRPDGAEPRTLARHQARARRFCLCRLDRLIAFSRKTSIVADEEARQILVSELMKVDEEWRSRSWEELSAPGDGFAAMPGEGSPER
jgi:hypothetical protein